MPKKELLELKVKVTASEELQKRIEHGLLGSGIFDCNRWTVNKVYETVALSKKYYDDGSNAPIYYIFDDTGELKETSTTYWVKLDD